ncbi:mucin-19 [Pipistrellus kuhlii]|uniref:mucin-19 n=1 Tax=Pipistrellus kuhlii TaxID=59472 RepID=UPI001E27115E|nr:mucin-19 [Pipistrellus kuhlii]
MKSPVLTLGDLLVGGSSFDESDRWKSVTVSYFNTEDGSPGKAEGRRRERRDTESLELEDIGAEETSTASGSDYGDSGGTTTSDTDYIDSNKNEAGVKSSSDGSTTGPPSTPEKGSHIPEATPTYSETNTIIGEAATWDQGAYKAFNGHIFSFESSCTYTFCRHCVESGDFNIEIKRNSDSEIEKIMVLIDNNDISISGDTLLVNGESVQIPYNNKLIHIKKYGEYNVLNSRRGILSLLWDKNNTLSLTLHKQYPTCGLCGNFNTTPGEDINEHIDNSKISDDCPQATSKTYETCEAGVEYCNKIIGTYFEECTKVSALSSDYKKVCIDEYCQKRDKKSTCDTYSELSRLCASDGPGKYESWRDDSDVFCEKPQCPEKHIYKECGLSNPATCSNVAPFQDSECVSGCTCPEGYLLDDIGEKGKCVLKVNCPCESNGIVYQSGEVREGPCGSQCTCQEAKWSCTEAMCPGRCKVEGSSITTFDGEKYNHPGNCHFLAIYDKDWFVSVELRECPSGMSGTCLNSVTVALNASGSVDKYVFHRDGTVSNDKIENQHYYSSDQIQIFKASLSYFQVETNFHVKMQIQTDPVMQLYVSMPPNQFTDTVGLCGSYNNRAEDDFMSSQNILEKSSQAFADSWEMMSCPKGNPASCISIETERFAEKQCGILLDSSGPFASCHPYVNPKPYHEECKKYTCACEDSQECLCTILGNYVKTCAEKETHMEEWRTGRCDHSCPSGFVFKYNVKACNSSCRSLSERDRSCDIEDVPVDGCACPDGMYQDNEGNCVSKSQCDCYMNDEVIKPGKLIQINDNKCVCRDGILLCQNPIDLTRQNCPGGAEYVDCSDPNAKKRVDSTCSTRNIPNFGEDLPCKRGCYCPVGMVRDSKGNCVFPDDCPCSFGGREYSQGSVTSVGCNKCTCIKGSWECTQNECQSTCHIYGEGHVQTFDKKSYSFDGLCQYSFVEDYCGGENGTFRILTESVPCCEDGLTCSRKIVVAFQDQNVILQDGKVTAIKTSESKECELNGNAYTVHTVGLYLILKFASGITVIWDKNTRMTVILEPYWNGKVCGLCGNSNGDLKDDFTTRHSSVATGALEFGNSWKTSQECSDTVTQTFPCDSNPYCKAWAVRKCEIIRDSTFRECHSKVDPTTYYDACMEEACACDMEGKYMGFCTAVAMYAEACGAVGVCVPWRKPDLCPVYCDYYNAPGECSWHYEPCGTVTAKTCKDQVIGQKFSALLEGCYAKCPESAPYLDENTMKCVKLSECSCFYNDVIPAGGVIKDNCGRTCYCIAGELECSETGSENATVTVSTTTATSRLSTTTEIPLSTRSSGTATFIPEITTSSSETIGTTLTLPSEAFTTGIMGTPFPITFTSGSAGTTGVVGPLFTSPWHVSGTTGSSTSTTTGAKAPKPGDTGLREAGKGAPTAPPVETEQESTPGELSTEATSTGTGATSTGKSGTSEGSEDFTTAPGHKSTNGGDTTVPGTTSGGRAGILGLQLGKPLKHQAVKGHPLRKDFKFQIRNVLFTETTGTTGPRSRMTGTNGLAPGESRTSGTSESETSATGSQPPESSSEGTATNRPSEGGIGTTGPTGVMTGTNGMESGKGGTSGTSQSGTTATGSQPSESSSEGTATNRPSEGGIGTTGPTGVMPGTNGMESGKGVTSGTAESGTSATGSQTPESSSEGSATYKTTEGVIGTTASTGVMAGNHGLETGKVGPSGTSESGTSAPGSQPTESSTGRSATNRPSEGGIGTTGPTAIMAGTNGVESGKEGTSGTSQSGTSATGSQAPESSSEGSVNNRPSEGGIESTGPTGVTPGTNGVESGKGGTSATSQSGTSATVSQPPESSSEGSASNRPSELGIGTTGPTGGVSGSNGLTPEESGTSGTRQSGTTGSPGTGSGTTESPPKATGTTHTTAEGKGRTGPSAEMPGSTGVTPGRSGPTVTYESGAPGSPAKGSATPGSSSERPTTTRQSAGGKETTVSMGPMSGTTGVTPAGSETTGTSATGSQPPESSSEGSATNRPSEGGIGTTGPTGGVSGSNGLTPEESGTSGTRQSGTTGSPGTGSGTTESPPKATGTTRSPAEGKGRTGPSAEMPGSTGVTPGRSGTTGTSLRDIAKTDSSFARPGTTGTSTGGTGTTGPRGGMAGTSNVPPGEPGKSATSESGTTGSPGTGSGTTESPPKATGTTHSPAEGKGRTGPSAEMPGSTGVTPGRSGTSATSESGTTGSPGTGSGTTESPPKATGTTRSPAEGKETTVSMGPMSGTTGVTPAGSGTTGTSLRGSGTTESPPKATGTTHSPAEGKGRTGPSAEMPGSNGVTPGRSGTSATSESGTTGSPGTGSGTTESPPKATGTTRSPAEGKETTVSMGPMSGTTGVTPAGSGTTGTSLRGSGTTESPPKATGTTHTTAEGKGRTGPSAEMPGSTGVTPGRSGPTVTYESGAPGSPAKGSATPGSSSERPTTTRQSAGGKETTVSIGPMSGTTGVTPAGSGTTGTSLRGSGTTESSSEGSATNKPSEGGIGTTGPTGGVSGSNGITPEESGTSGTRQAGKTGSPGTGSGTTESPPKATGTTRSPAEGKGRTGPSSEMPGSTGVTPGRSGPTVTYESGAPGSPAKGSATPGSSSERPTTTRQSAGGKETTVSMGPMSGTTGVTPAGSGTTGTSLRGSGTTESSSEGSATNRPSEGGIRTTGPTGGVSGSNGITPEESGTSGTRQSGTTGSPGTGSGTTESPPKATGTTRSPAEGKETTVSMGPMSGTTGVTPAGSGTTGTSLRGSGTTESSSEGSATNRPSEGGIRTTGPTGGVSGSNGITPEESGTSGTRQSGTTGSPGTGSGTTESPPKATGTTHSPAEGKETTVSMGPMSGTTGVTPAGSGTTGTSLRGSGTTESPPKATGTTRSPAEGKGRTGPSAEMPGSTGVTPGRSGTMGTSTEGTGTTGPRGGMAGTSNVPPGEPGTSGTSESGTSATESQPPESSPGGSATNRPSEGGIGATGPTVVMPGTNGVESGKGGISATPESGTSATGSQAPESSSEGSASYRPPEGGIPTTGPTGGMLGTSGFPRNDITNSGANKFLPELIAGTTGVAPGTTVAPGSSKTEATTFLGERETTTIGVATATTVAAGGSTSGGPKSSSPGTSQEASETTTAFGISTLVCHGPTGEEKSPGDTWTANCHKCSCTKANAVDCKPKECPSPPTCKDGERLVKFKDNDTCCEIGYCEPRTCLFNNTDYEIGASFDDPNNPCISYSCDKTGFRASVQDCPKQTWCAEADRVYDSKKCCYKCNTSCRTSPVNVTVSYNGCKKRFEMTRCIGECKQSISYNYDIFQLQNSCHCCQAETVEYRQVLLDCPGGHTSPYKYRHITGCSCSNKCHQSTSSSHS